MKQVTSGLTLGFQPHEAGSFFFCFVLGYITMVTRTDWLSCSVAG